MKLKKRIETLDEVPEALQDLYVEDAESGGYLLDYVDTDAKAKVDEFRNGNRKLNRELQELRERLEAYAPLGDLNAEDVEALKMARERQRHIEQDELLRDLIDSSGSVNQEKLKHYADKQFEGERKDLLRQIESLSSERDTLTEKFTGAQQKYRDQIRNAAVRDAVTSVARTKQGAMDDIISRAERSLGFDDNDNLVVLDGDGEVRYGKRGGDPMTVQEWAAELVDNAQHLFDGRMGGGASGDGGAKNPRGGPMVNADNPEELGRNFKSILAGEAQIRTNL